MFPIFERMPLNPKLHHIIIGEIKKLLGKKSEEPLSRYQMAKGTLVAKRVLWNAIRNALLMAVGISSAAFGLEGFLIPNGLIDGGVTGISLLTSRATGISLPILLVLINLPFVLMGWRQISSMFAIKSIISIAVLAIVIATVHFPVVTNDKLLVGVFGGFFLGAGIGLTIRGGGAGQHLAGAGQADDCVC